MILLKEMPNCHYFFARFFVWNGMSVKNLDQTMKTMADYSIFPGYREIVLKPGVVPNSHRVGNYEYIATNKADFVVSCEKEGVITIELLREIDPSVPIKYIDQKRYMVTYVPLPIDSELMGELHTDLKESIDLFFEEIERQKIAMIDV